MFLLTCAISGIECLSYCIAIFYQFMFKSFFNVKLSRRPNVSNLAFCIQCSMVLVDLTIKKIISDPLLNLLNRHFLSFVYVSHRTTELFKITSSILIMIKISSKHKTFLPCEQ